MNLIGGGATPELIAVPSTTNIRATEGTEKSDASGNWVTSHRWTIPATYTGRVSYLLTFKHKTNGAAGGSGWRVYNNTAGYAIPMPNPHGVLKNVQTYYTEWRVVCFGDPGDVIDLQMIGYATTVYHKTIQILCDDHRGSVIADVASWSIAAV